MLILVAMIKDSQENPADPIGGIFFCKPSLISQ